jgi:hypothetical protein
MKFFQKPPKKQCTDPFEPIPCGETVETDWAAWEETLASHTSPLGRVQAAQHLPTSTACAASTVFVGSAWASL